MIERTEIIAVIRVWKKHPKTPIIIFPREKDYNYLVQMWEPVGQHGNGDPYSVIQRTRPATESETADVVHQYENYYDAKLIVRKRMPRIDWSLK
jgi:hypothetical protein